MLYRSIVLAWLLTALSSPAMALPQTPDATSRDAAYAAIDTHAEAAQGPGHGSKRPFRAAMGFLYTTAVALQVYDVDSTLRSMRRGGVELNPLMSMAASNPRLFLGIKAAGVATTFWATHKIAKRHKAAAILTLVTLNSAYAWVIQRNYEIAAR